MELNHDNLANIEAGFRFPDEKEPLLEDFTVQEIVMMESLLTPGIQTIIKAHSFVHTLPKKDFDKWKNIITDIKIQRPILKRMGFPEDTMQLRQTVYRIANRRLINNNNEEYTIYACDNSLLNNARSLVSNKWNCRLPHEVVRETLSQCCGVPLTKMEIESTSTPRDYIAENVHPFEVCKQQADVALTSSMDPSFVHYMTYENFGTHHFKSLESLCKQTPSKLYTFKYSEAAGSKLNDQEKQAGYANPNNILTYSFPCDFDLLADLLNGIEADGSDITSIVTINPFLGQFSLSGVQSIDCGIGKGVYKMGLTNINSAQQQSSCNIGIEYFMLKRQARMNLLEQDKIALRMTIPWNPNLHAGKVIKIELYNKTDNTIMLHGSGDYLISSMVHTVKRGGYSTTTLDCVSTTVGKGQS